MLSAALDRVAGVGQERPLGGPVGSTLGSVGPPRLQWAIVGAALLLLLLGAIAGAGAMLARPAVPPLGVSNGWVAVSANPRDSVGSGEAGDIYLVTGKGVAARRIVGSDRDGVAQACPRFSPHGRRLAYGEGRLRLLLARRRPPPG